MTPNEIFQAMANNISLTDILPLATTTSREHYYYIKAFKLVNKGAFMRYCKQHKDVANRNDFCLMLMRILEENYPPLKCCHIEQDGYPELSQFVAMARTILN